MAGTAGAHHHVLIRSDGRPPAHRRTSIWTVIECYDFGEDREVHRHFVAEPGFGNSGRMGLQHDADDVDELGILELVGLAPELFDRELQVGLVVISRHDRNGALGLSRMAFAGMRKCPRERCNEAGLGLRMAYHQAWVLFDNVG